MRIDKRLNFIVPIEREDGPTVYVHAMPLPREAFERYAVILAQTFSAIHNKGIGLISAPRVAAVLLKELAIKDGSWEGPEGVEAGLIQEIRRLSNAIIKTDAGWKPVPIGDALKRGALSPEEAAEVDGLVTFFIVISAMQRRDEVDAILNYAANAWGALTSFSNCTDFAVSLTTSTAGAGSKPAGPSSKP